MNIINLIKKWLFKEEKIGIINIGDIIQIPGREYFKEEPGKTTQIDIYKEEYLKILSRRKLITSKQLSFDNLDELMLMNIDLVLRLFLDEEELQHKIVDVRTKVNMYIDKEIKIKKLKLYLNDINNMETETIQKLIALKELAKGKRVPHINRFILNEKINQLTLSFITFLKRKYALQKEIINHQLINNIQPDNIEYCLELATKKYKDLLITATPHVDKKIIDYIENANIDIYSKIAILEKELEMYVYTSKEKAALMHEEVKELTKRRITSNNKEKLLTIIKAIENKYLIFDIYGRNLTSKDDWRNLYKLKFDILTLNINELNESPFIYINNREIKYYEEIISKKIEKILMNDNECIKNIYGNDYKEAIKLIVFELKGVTQFRPHWILYNKLKLALLLSFERKGGIVDFFNDNKIDLTNAIRNFSLNYNHRIFTFADELSLDTCFQIMSAYEDKNNKQTDSLYKLYKLTEKQPQYLVNDGCYFIPDGLVKINVRSASDYYDPLLIEINKKSHKNLVYLPESLEEIHGSIFRTETEPREVLLNDGLKIIYGRAFKGKVFEHLYIPPSVEYISPDSFDFKSINWLHFMDYENSKLLHDEGAMLILIKELFYVVKVNTDQGFEKIENIDLTIYRERIKVALRTNLVDIYLLDNEQKEKLTINAINLEYIKNRWRDNTKDKTPSYYSYDYSGKWQWYTDKNIYSLQVEDAVEILEKITAIIKNEIGYDVKFIEKPNIKTKVKDY